MKQSERMVHCWGKLPKSLVAEFFIVLCSFSVLIHTDNIKCGGVKHRIVHACPHLLNVCVFSFSYI